MTVSSVPDLYVLTVAFLALKNLVFSLFRTPLKKFKFFFYKIISADVSVFKINNKKFLTPIKWRNGPPKLLIIDPFIPQSSPGHSPELTFHIMKSRDQTSVLLSVLLTADCLDDHIIDSPPYMITCTILSTSQFIHYFFFIIRAFGVQTWQRINCNLPLPKQAIMSGSHHCFARDERTRHNAMKEKKSRLWSWGSIYENILIINKLSEI